MSSNRITTLNLAGVAALLSRTHTGPSILLSIQPEPDTSFSVTLENELSCLPESTRTVLRNDHAAIVITENAEHADALMKAIRASCHFGSALWLEAILYVKGKETDRHSTSGRYDFRTMIADPPLEKQIAAISAARD